MVTSNRKTTFELDKETARDIVRSVVRVQASDFFRRRMNEVWPQVSDRIDELTALGAKVDIPALVREVMLEHPLEIGQ